jgi:hypothetical protein
MPHALKPFYCALLYQCYHERTETLVCSTRRMLHLADVLSMEAVKAKLAQLRQRKFLTWHIEGIGRQRRWMITVTAVASSMPIVGEQEKAVEVQHEEEEPVDGRSATAAAEI